MFFYGYNNYFIKSITKQKTTQHNTTQHTMSVIERSMRKFHTFIKKINFDTKKYQDEGMEWVLSRELNTPSYQIKGGIIADEMGLGKTLLMLGSMVTNFHKGDKNLIVVPLSVLNQWRDIIKNRFKLNPLVYHGTNAKKITIDDLEDPNKSFVVLTTYGMISKRSKDWVSDLWRVEWTRFICDEAHHLRNDTKQFHGALEVIASIKWMVTGTPICNSINDLYNLLKVVGFSKKHILNPTKFNDLIKYCMLRRTKISVGLQQQLPGLKENNIFVPFNNENEKKLAELIHRNLSDEPNQYISCQNLISRHHFSDLMRQRQVCLSTNLIGNALKKKKKKIHCDNGDELRNIYETIDHISELNQSSKLVRIKNDILRSVLYENQNTTFSKNKKIVFCVFKHEINYFMRAFGEKDLVVDYISGEKTRKERELILEIAPDILILQIQTSCEGLNLQEYNELYFTAPSWNPAIENQAVARVYRLGQKKPVSVYKYYSVFDSHNTIDNHMKMVQDDKQDIFDYYINIQNNACSHHHKKCIKNPKDNCSICMEPLKNNLVQLQCGHVYHRECVKNIQNFGNKCALCRCDIESVTEVKIPKKIKKKKKEKKNIPIGHTHFSFINPNTDFIPIGHTKFSY